MKETAVRAGTLRKEATTCLLANSRWDELKRVVSGDGPRNPERIALGCRQRGEFRNWPRTDPHRAPQDRRPCVHADGSCVHADVREVQYW
ncbi:hypothetical protein [Streptomyces sp. NPDC006739]|uniref:hypothetical protein n=1 Tax=Streptomyces sp. NPDC006739 TaxID=3364763 RepID=UPI0036BD3AAC